MPQIIREDAGATPTRTGPGRVLLTLITPGVGSSGTYTKEVLAQAAKDKVWPRGTQSHINHDSAVERMDRPEGNLRNMVGVLLEDAYVSDDGALVAEALIGSAWRSFVEEFKDFIGASIVASAEVKDTKNGRIIERLLPDPFNRVDLVTVAGRGGNVTEILESARRIESVSMVNEATANDTREWLQAALKDTYSGDNVLTWLRDYDATTVWFEREGAGEVGIYQQSYTLDGTTVTLTGDPTEVRVETRYVPVETPAEESKNVPSNPAGPTQPNDVKETNMGKIEVDESVHATAVEASGRVPALEAENADLKVKLAESTKKDNDSTAAAVVAEAFAGIDAPATVKLLASTYTLTAEGAVDTAALKAKAEESAAEIAVSFGAGNVHGVGTTAAESKGNTRTADDIVSVLEGGK